MKELGDRMTIPAGVLLLSFLMCVAGIAMVFMQIKDAGTLDLSTPILEGKLKSGFVGITLVFLSIVLSVFSLVVVAKREIEIRLGGMSVHLRGSFSRRAIFEVISSIQRNSHKRWKDSAQQSNGETTSETAPSAVSEASHP